MISCGIPPEDRRIRLVDGFFAESLTDTIREEIQDLIFINMDVDLYVSTIQVLDFIGPILKPGVVIYWDDWKDPVDSEGKKQDSDGWGEHAAWETWYESQPFGLKVETVETNPLNQRYMVVTEHLGKPLTRPSLKEIRHHAFQLTKPGFPRW